VVREVEDNVIDPLHGDHHAAPDVGRFEHHGRSTISPQN
jgi:hypothetical protein